MPTASDTAVTHNSSLAARSIHAGRLAVATATCSLAAFCFQSALTPARRSMKTSSPLPRQGIPTADPLLSLEIAGATARRVTHALHRCFITR